MSLEVTDKIYVSTISDLGGSMLKLDMFPGTYQLKEFIGGYMLTTERYDPNEDDIIKIFNDRDGNKGMAGTYWDGETDDRNLLYLFNDFIYQYLTNEFKERYELEFEDYDDYYYDSEEEGYASDEIRGRAEKLHHYNNVPVFFYLNTAIIKEDLNYIILEPNNDLKNVGNVKKIWRVKCIRKKSNPYIGLAVQQEEFYNMMGDQAGLALLHSSDSKARALGNFDSNVIWRRNREYDWMEPYYEYICKFNPCDCDVIHSFYLTRRRQQQEDVGLFL